jgi:hypothetical protein
MRVLVAWILALGLVASPVMAKAGRTSDDTAAKADSNSDATAKGKTDGSAAASKTDSTPSATTPTKTESATLEVEFQQLRELLESQAAQLKAQSEQLKQQQQKMDALEKQLNVASSAPAGPAGVVTGTESSSSAASAPAAGIITAGIPNNNGKSPNASAPSQDAKADEPPALHFKGITITPGGFMAAETVWRSKALSADVNTPFNAAPMPGASNSNLSEFNASGRQSRISMLAEGKLANVKIGGYYEGDFLGAGSASNSNQSNSYVFRQRQFWAQAAFDNGFKVTGGQMWSLVTETTKGMDNRTEALPNTIDAQYTIGFSWARQYGLRFTKSFGDKFWLGMAVEGAQTTFTVHGNPTQSVTTGATTVSCPVPGTGGCSATGTISVGGTTTVYTNFLLGATGASSGLYNPLANYSYNAAPDFVFKAALEPGFGHYEVFGVISRFRDRIFPCEIGTVGNACAIDATQTIPTANDAYNDARTGGGAGANARWTSKHVDFGVHFLGGSGIGRYGSGGLSDATIRPDGTIALLRNYQSLGTLQFHITPKFDLNLNGGGEYSSRAAYTTLAGKAEGYGNPLLSNAGCYQEIGPNQTVPVGTTGAQGYIPGSLANCTSDTRALIEGSLGFWYRFYKGPKGTIQFGSQYSYYVRHTWEGVAPASGAGAGVSSPHSVENMWFTSFRYYLP